VALCVRTGPGPEQLSTANSRSPGTLARRQTPTAREKTSICADAGDGWQSTGAEGTHVGPGWAEGGQAVVYRGPTYRTRLPSPPRFSFFDAIPAAAGAVFFNRPFFYALLAAYKPGR